MIYMLMLGFSLGLLVSIYSLWLYMIHLDKIKNQIKGGEK